MKKKICILLALLCGACSVEEANIKNEPLPAKPSQGFDIQTFSTTQTFEGKTWLLWKDHDHISDVLVLSKKMEGIQKKAKEIKIQGAEIKQNLEHYMIEQMGADNYQTMRGYNQQLANLQSKVDRLKELKEKEMAKPVDERNEERIAKIEKRIAQTNEQMTPIQEEKKSLMDSLLSQNDYEQIQAMKVELRDLQMQGKKLEAKAEWYLACKGEPPEGEKPGKCIHNLVEYNMAPPQLNVNLGEKGIDIALIGFENQEGDLCSTMTNTIPRDSVNMDYKKGKLEFSLVCKQRESLPEGHIDSYTLQLEKVSSDPIRLEGNIARCTDIAPERGKCRGGLSMGIVKFQQ